MQVHHKILTVLTFAITIFTLCTGAKTSRKLRKGLLRQKETNPVNFIRLVVMRLIYGMATRMGFGENISEALNGAFVPPGVEEDYDFDLSDQDDYDF
ncbi:uncharacterized protein LOC116162426 [Photinus pyralis]|uniref:uncharacterized protein LOC116162426 n=1 Tax=Photinus pyralis TaxID=7054 RepID=UPI001266F6C0|nr:uncharacterized protein LOC116162426 [Photinus pyralis]